MYKQASPETDMVSMLVSGVQWLVQLKQERISLPLKAKFRFALPKSEFALPPPPPRKWNFRFTPQSEISLRFTLKRIRFTPPPPKVKFSLYPSKRKSVNQKQIFDLTWPL